MLYFYGVYMKKVEPGFKAVKTEIVAVFHNKIIFREMNISGFVS